jgi:hypothetical protein
MLCHYRRNFRYVYFVTTYLIWGREWRAMCACLRLLFITECIVITIKSTFIKLLRIFLVVCIKIVTHRHLIIGCTLTWREWGILIIVNFLIEVYWRQQYTGWELNKDRLSWIIELRDRFPWLYKTPPNCLNFKLLFLLSGLLYVMNRRVSNPCFSSWFYDL